MSLDKKREKDDINCIIIREVYTSEDDISAKEKAESKGSRIPCKDENCRRQKGTCKQKIKGKKKIISLGRRYCGLFFYIYLL